MSPAAVRDEVAFDGVYRTCYAGLVAQLFIVTTNRAEAEEVVQEAFTRLWLKWDTLRDYDNHEAWVRRVATNIAISRWRRYSRMVHLEDDEARTGELDAASVDLIKALKAIPTKHRQALVLHYLADLSVQEVATEMSTRPGTVKSWLSRGRTALQQQLYAQEGEPDG